MVVFFHPAGWHGRLYWHTSLQGSHFSHHNNCPPGSSRSHTCFNWEYGASQPCQHINPGIALYKFPCSTGVISFQLQQNDPTAWKLSLQVLPSIWSNTILIYSWVKSIQTFSMTVHCITEQASTGYSIPHATKAATFRQIHVVTRHLLIHHICRSVLLSLHLSIVSAWLPLDGFMYKLTLETCTKIRQKNVTLVTNGQIYWAFYVRTQVHSLLQQHKFPIKVLLCNIKYFSIAGSDI
jgi:hypothetical protein